MEIVQIKREIEKMEEVLSILIGVAILLYAVWVIVRRVKDFRKGKYCSCGCGTCGKCKKEEKAE